jgi:4'-phosphopantetheinyl transferase
VAQSASSGADPVGIEVWFACVTPSLACQALGSLSAQVIEELEGLQQVERSRRAVQLALRRSVLADHLKVPLSSIAVSANRAGPIESPSPKLKLSASHHDDVTVLAICEEASSIGIDLEPAYEPGWEDAVQEVLTERELASLSELGADECRSRAYFTCWTLKEAIMKALGEGLDERSPASIEVSVPPAVATLISIDGTLPTRSWNLRSVQLDGHVCSLAMLDAGPIGCRCRRWPLDSDGAIL